jgi:hypothetical protein
VVVEDHRGRHGRQHPADHLLAPRQPVELRVLHEVLDLQAGRLVEAAPRGHELLELLVGGGVGVHLVAEQQQDIRPGHVGVVAQRQGQGAQRVDAVRLVALGVVRARRATGAEREVRQAVRVERADAAGRHPGARPDGHVVDGHGIRVVAAGDQPVEHDEGVVGPVHRHRRRAPRAAGPLDRDAGSGCRAHPHGRRRLVDVAEHGTEDERLVELGDGRGHGGHPARVGRPMVSTGRAGRSV